MELGADWCLGPDELVKERLLFSRELTWDFTDWTQNVLLTVAFADPVTTLPGLVVFSATGDDLVTDREITEVVDGDGDRLLTFFFLLYGELGGRLVIGLDSPAG